MSADNHALKRGPASFHPDGAHASSGRPLGRSGHARLGGSCGPAQ
jgi:hypothetical protein